MTDGTEFTTRSTWGKEGDTHASRHRPEVAPGLDRRPAAAHGPRRPRCRASRRSSPASSVEQEIASALDDGNDKPPLAAGVLRSGSPASMPAVGAFRRSSCSNAAFSSPSWRSTGLSGGDSRGAVCGWWRRAGAPSIAAPASVRSARAASPAAASMLCRIGVLGRRQLDLGLFLVGLGERHLAFLDRAMQQQPGGELHQPRGQPHAFGGVSERGGAHRASWIPGGRDRRDRSRSPRPAPCRRGTDPQRPANWRACSPNDTGSALFKNLSMTLYALPTRPGFALVGLAASIAAGPAPVQTTERDRDVYIVVVKLKTRTRIDPKWNKKRAAVAGGSKLITGRRQTEWTGATQCP